MYRTVRNIVFALTRGDAEMAHTLARRSAYAIQTFAPYILPLIAWQYEAAKNPRPVTLWDTTFPNRIGLAAGFDKHAEMLPLLQALGFGFIEIGTVLPFYQKGNDRPRLFRLPEHDALINRMGFNSEGAEAVAMRLEQIHDKLRVPLWISISKMKTTLNEIEAVSHDNRMSWKHLKKYARVGVINVSSPNTPDLRALQNAAYIESLVRDIVGYDYRLTALRAKAKVPFLVKFAPDMAEGDVVEAGHAAASGGAAGFIAGNTTVRRVHLQDTLAQETGGLSGPPVYDLNLALMRTLKREMPHMPVVFCGGVDSPDRAKRAFDEGASLVQVLTGLVYHGPKLVSQLRAVS